MVLMMYLSSRGVQKMTFEDKQRSIERTLASVKERVDLQASDPREQRLSERVMAFIQDMRSSASSSSDAAETGENDEPTAEEEPPIKAPEMGAPLALPLSSPRSM